MNTPPMLQRHPALRWLAPVGIVCIAGLAATGVFASRASSSESLPGTTPAGLIAAVQNTRVDGFSGTVVSHLSLGLPELPAIGDVGDGTSFTSLLSGSHTMQVWYGGADRQRVALLGSTDETDVFRDGTDLWQWSSADHSAVHAAVPVAPPGARTPGGLLPSSVASLTPLQLAKQALGALEPSTTVRVDADHDVADRSTYDLVLTPRTSATKVGEIRISVDGQTKIPLAVQVTARGAEQPAIDVAFTNIVFGHQPERNFQFDPPAGATVHQVSRSGSKPAPAGSAGRRAGVRTVGSGWSAVLDATPTATQFSALRRNSVLSALSPVSGSWGSGRLLDSELLSVLVTSDGHVLVGAVAPDTLYAAAGRK